MSSSSVRIGFLGAAPDTPNMGVSALYRSFLYGVSRFCPEGTTFTVFDYGLGIRERAYEQFEQRICERRVGIRTGKRVFLPENFYQIDLLSRTSFGPRINRVLDQIDQCDVFVDVSGGDSFSDIYGARRFRRVLGQKEIVLRRRKPLHLLPQTYGPYKQAPNKRAAAEVLRHCESAWARDERSYGILQQLLGYAFDPTRHLCGIDLAFSLPSVRPVELPDEVAYQIESGQKPVGLNVSGLVWNDRENHFGFRASYRDILIQLVESFEKEDVPILLIPHVNNPAGSIESDVAACQELLNLIESPYRSRIHIVPNTLNECEVKWVISQCDWFCGTRMHSTIAGLSSATPTASIVYSDKASGVFASCGLENSAIDPRQLGTDGVLSLLQADFQSRSKTRVHLESALPALRHRSEAQLNRIASNVLASVAR